jgi:hypothetical protein
VQQHSGWWSQIPPPHTATCVVRASVKLRRSRTVHTSSLQIRKGDRELGVDILLPKLTVRFAAEPCGLHLSIF